VDTIRQYLRADLVDDVHLAIVPVLLGRGERLLDGLPDSPRDYVCTEVVTSPAVTHVRLTRAGGTGPG
jgi:dihydrofolate reductase